MGFWGGGGNLRIGDRFETPAKIRSLRSNSQIARIFAPPKLINLMS